MSTGSITIVGTGIKSIGQLTLEAVDVIRAAEVVFYLVADPLTAQWIRDHNDKARSLEHHYADAKRRIDSYRGMVDEVLESARDGHVVGVAFYGHPGIFVYPSHEIVRRARMERITACMLPGISADACLFADLGVDPARAGCAGFEATDFLVHQRRFDPNVGLVLWQVGLIGDLTYRQEGYDPRANLDRLARRLTTDYGEEHEVTLYEAAQYPICGPRIERMPLSHLAEAGATPISTLYIPPLASARADSKVMEQLGMKPEFIA
ncbi:MAG TPA: SAM-dependent methyltransferase [Usitatibacter sp.]|nr:SAM-dependent methyltransferase [Usitatibacter sp.]